MWGRAVTYFFGSTGAFVLFLLTQVWDYQGNRQNASFWSDRFPAVLEWLFFLATIAGLLAGFGLVWRGRAGKKSGVIGPPPAEPERPLPVTVKSVPAPIAQGLTETNEAPATPNGMYDMSGSDVLDYAAQHSGLPCIDDIEDSLAEAARMGDIHVRAKPDGHDLLNLIRQTRYVLVSKDHFNYHTFYLVSPSCKLYRNFRPSFFEFLKDSSGYKCAIVRTDSLDNFAALFTPPSHVFPRFIRSEIGALWPPR